MSIESSTFSGNRAFIAPAISNTVSLTLSDTGFDDNFLFCDDSEFLDWVNVSGGTVVLEHQTDQYAIRLRATRSKDVLIGVMGIDNAKK